MYRKSVQPNSSCLLEADFPLGTNDHHGVMKLTGFKDILEDTGYKISPSSHVFKHYIVSTAAPSLSLIL